VLTFFRLYILYFLLVVDDDTVLQSFLLCLLIEDLGTLVVECMSACNQPPRSTQPPTLSRTGTEYQPKCGDALWL